MCLGFLATEGYHAGAVREQLIQQAFDPVVYYGSMQVYEVTGVRLLVAYVPCRPRSLLGEVWADSSAVNP